MVFFVSSEDKLSHMDVTFSATLPLEFMKAYRNFSSLWDLLGFVGAAPVRLAQY